MKRKTYRRVFLIMNRMKRLGQKPTRDFFKTAPSNPFEATRVTKPPILVWSFAQTSIDVIGSERLVLALFGMLGFKEEAPGIC